MNTELKTRILNYVSVPYSYGWDADDAYFAPPVGGCDSFTEDEVVAQNSALNDPAIAERVYVQFVDGMEVLLANSEHCREEQELANMDKYSEYESKFNFYGSCVGSRKLASIEYLAEPAYRHKPRKGKARKERFTRKTHNASRGRLVHCEEE